MTDSVPSPESEAPDGVLVRRVAEGSSAALGALYDRYGRPAFALATRITGNPGLAEDVVEAVFVQLWRDPVRYDPSRGGFPGWLLAATHHQALEATRQVAAARRCREELAALTVRGGDSDSDVSVGDRGGRTRRALGALPAPEREALVLAYFGGHTQQEIAADTGVPIETVRSRMVCGVRQLRALLDDAPTPEVAP